MGAALATGTGKGPVQGQRHFLKLLVSSRTSSTIRKQLNLAQCGRRCIRRSLRRDGARAFFDVMQTRDLKVGSGP
jgi:hypothetical protein